MDRRGFNRLVLGLLGSSAMKLSSAEPVAKMENSPSRHHALPLEALRAQYHKYLFDDYLPFHERFVIDRQLGGFLCTVRINGELVSETKPIWFQGRGLWVYSFLYNNFGREQKFLEVAEGARKLIERSRPKDPNEFWPKTLNRDGSAASPADPELYGDMFIAEGLAELSKAPGEKKYWDQAKELVFKCVRR